MTSRPTVSCCPPTGERPRRRETDRRHGHRPPCRAAPPTLKTPKSPSPSAAHGDRGRRLQPRRGLHYHHSGWRGQRFRALRPQPHRRQRQRRRRDDRRHRRRRRHHGHGTAVTIEDDEAPPRGIVLSVPDIAVDEGASAGWTVRLSEVPDGPVVVTVSGHEDTDLSLDTPGSNSTKPTGTACGR